jgi:ribosomal protein S18 acetylase RimI-like enzyme
MNITTRPAVDADKDFARVVHHLAYREVVEKQYGPWDEDDQDRRFAGNWDSGEFDALLRDGEMCGYVSVEIGPDQISIRELVIHPKFQNQGVGSTFLLQVMAKAKVLKIPVRLGTHLLNRATAFYQRLGFREFDRTETHVLMEWK